MAWSDAARAAAAEMRRRRAAGKSWRRAVPSSVNHAQKLIEASRKLGPGYLKVPVLLKAAHLKQSQAQRGLRVLMGPRGERSGWSVYTELPFGKGKVLFTPHGFRVGRILLLKKK